MQRYIRSLFCNVYTPALFVFISVFLITLTLIASPRQNKTIVLNSSKVKSNNESVVEINGPGMCSGVIVLPGVVITASHCVSKKKKKVLIRFYDKEIREFELIFKGVETSIIDLAVLKGSTKGYKHTPLSTKIPKMFTIINHYGYGSQRGQARTPGVWLHGYLNEKGDPEVAFVANIIPGDSGGPVMDYDSKYIYGIAYKSYWPIHVDCAMAVPSRVIYQVLYNLKFITEPLGPDTP